MSHSDCCTEIEEVEPKVKEHMPDVLVCPRDIRAHPRSLSDETDTRIVQRLDVVCRTGQADPRYRPLGESFDQVACYPRGLAG